MELASYSKRLQGHLLAYLVLQDKKDQSKVFDRYHALWEMTSILDDRLNDEFSRGILNQIKTDIVQIIRSAQALLKIDSRDELKKRPVTQVNEEALIREIDTLCESVSGKALAIAGHNVTMEIMPKQEALGQVKKLSGMLPICSSCKKIRDDSGYWRQVEEYVRDHSEAEFTHSICPDCLRRLYPEIADEILSSKNKDS